MIVNLIFQPTKQVSSESTSSELLRKPAIRKIVFYAIDIYTFKLLLNVVAAGIEVFVPGNTFWYICDKQSAVCELSNVLTPSINS
jgi:hypothetical protein